MTYRWFCWRHGDFWRISENFLNTWKLTFVALRRWCAMCINVSDVFWRNFCITNCHFHSKHCTFWFWLRSCNVICVTWKSISNNFAINFRTTSFCVLKLFHNQNCATFTDHKTISVRRPRTWCKLWSIIKMCWQSFYRSKSGNTKPTNSSFSCSCEDNVCTTIFD